MLTIFLIYVLWGIVEVTRATQPATIFYYVTVRSFIPQVCDPSRVTNSTLTNNCPSGLISQVTSGQIKGHPDFESDRSPKLLNTFNFNRVGPYRGKYARSGGLQFPLTRNGGAGAARPFVLSDLVIDTTGIGKMQYCMGEEGFLCDYNGTINRQTFSNESFSTWHRDDPQFNIRSGYKQTLYLTSNQYKFDSSTSPKPPPTNFYSPITENGLDGWPRSTGIETTTTKKFWFTTEIHTSFQYKGGESFTFSGDDDVHVFINNRLAVNLGGVNNANSATLNVESFEQELGLVKDQIYSFDLFHAERHTSESNYALTTTLSEACNVVTSDFRSQGADVEKVIDWKVGGSTNDSEWVLVSGPNFGYIEPVTKQAILMTADIPNVASYMFHRQQHNTGSGFTLSFNFRMNGPGHGFAVVIHDRELGLQDFNGGSGPNLGIKNVDNSFAIVFDMCPNFPDCSSSTKSQLRMHYKLNGDKRNSVSDSTRKVHDPMVHQNWRDNKTHTVSILYFALPDWLEVYVDNSLRLVQKNFSMEQITGGRDASIGFTSSSSDESQMDVVISNVELKTVKVVPRLTLSKEIPSELPKPFIANGRDFVSFTLQTRDACLNEIEYGGFSSLVHGRLVATSVSPDPPSSGRRRLDDDNETTILIPEIADLSNGQYEIRFITDFLANFSVHMAFGEDCAWNGTAFSASSDCWTISYLEAAVSVPFSTSAPTSTEETSSISGPALAGIGVAVGIVSVCGSIALIVGVRIRNQWRREKKFIDEGKRVVAERGVAYKGDNELDALQNRLQATMHAIQAERAKRLKPEDKQSQIDELLRQKGELQEMVRRMKIIQAGGDPNAPEERSTLGGRMRKSFAASRVSRGVSLFGGGGDTSRKSRGVSVMREGSGEASSGNPLFQGLRQSLGQPRWSKPTSNTKSVQVAVGEDSDLPPPPLPNI